MTIARTIIDELNSRPLPEEFDLEYEHLLCCVAVGTIKEEHTIEVCCLGACQRPENPCIVDIDYCLEGDGCYEMVPELTMYSLDTTDGIDGTWHLLQAVTTDPMHSGRTFQLNGQRMTLRFVADMCDHVSSFFSDPRICYRITFRQCQDLSSTFGDFDDSRNPTVGEDPPEPDPDPTVTPKGGCREKYYGPRLPRD